MSNERSRRIDPTLQSALDQARASSLETQRMRESQDRASFLPDILSIMAPLLGAGVGAGVGGLVGGAPGAFTGAQTGSATGVGAQTLIQRFLAESERDLKRREAEDAGRSGAVNSVLLRR